MGIVSGTISQETVKNSITYRQVFKKSLSLGSEAEMKPRLRINAFWAGTPAGYNPESWPVDLDA